MVRICSVVIIFLAPLVLSQQEDNRICAGKTDEEMETFSKEIDRRRNEAVEQTLDGTAHDIAPQKDSKFCRSEDGFPHLLCPKSIVTSDIHERKIYFEISVLKEDMNKGSGPDPTAKAWKNRVGTTCDHSGHLLAKSMGGPEQLWNIYQQNPEMKTGPWNRMEQAFKEALEKCGDNDGCFGILRIHFIYKDTKRYPNRPTSILFDAKVAQVEFDSQGLPALDEEGKLVLRQTLFYKACEVANPNVFDTSIDYKNMAKICEMYREYAELAGDEVLNSFFLSEVKEKCQMY